jgi:hypothetical protein
VRPCRFAASLESGVARRTCPAAAANESKKTRCCGWRGIRSPAVAERDHVRYGHPGRRMGRGPSAVSSLRGGEGARPAPGWQPTTLTTAMRAPARCVESRRSSATRPARLGRHVTLGTGARPNSPSRQQPQWTATCSATVSSKTLTTVVPKLRQDHRGNLGVCDERRRRAARFRGLVSVARGCDRGGHRHRRELP